MTIRLHIDYRELRPIAPVFQICILQRKAGFLFTGVPRFTDSIGFPGRGKLIYNGMTIEMEQEADGLGAWFTFIAEGA